MSTDTEVWKKCNASPHQTRHGTQCGHGFVTISQALAASGLHYVNTTRAPPRVRALTISIIRIYRGNNIMSDITAWRFSEAASSTPPGQMPETHKEAKSWLKIKYTKGWQFGLDNLMKYGVYKLQGWNFNFKPYLKRYVYQQYGQWSECHAPNKTLLRQVVGGRIGQILEASY